MSSKGHVVARLIAELEAWLVEEKLCAPEDIAEVKRRNNITLRKQVALIEHFLFAPYDDNNMLAYVKAELEKARLFIFKLRQFEDHERAKQLAAQPVTENQLRELANRLERICRVLKY